MLEQACGGKLKILEPGEYVFTDARYDDFYMEGVTIHAVVGKNGCGKSSLIEMLFCMANNLAVLMTTANCACSGEGILQLYRLLHKVTGSHGLRDLRI